MIKRVDTTLFYGYISTGHCAEHFDADSGGVSNIPCGRGIQGMWWLSECGSSWLNGMQSGQPFILWKSWGGTTSLAESEIKMKPEKGSCGLGLLAE